VTDEVGRSKREMVLSDEEVRRVVDAGMGENEMELI
jgi:hypothetical protein